MPSEVTVLLPDGSARSVPDGTTIAELAAGIGRRLAAAAVAAELDGVLVDLSTPLVDGAEVRIVTSDTDEGRDVLRHSTAHVMAQAVLRLWPGARYAIGPAIADGFYYDFELPHGRPLLRGRPEPDRSGDAGDHGRVPAVRPRGAHDRRRPRDLRRAALQTRDHRTGRRGCRGPRRRAGGRSRWQSRRGQHLSKRPGVRGPVPRAACALDGSAGALQADAGGRGLLAGRRAQTTVAEGLRHRMGVGQGRSRPIFIAWRKPSGEITAGSGPSSTSSLSPPSSVRDWPSSTRRAGWSAR